MKLIVSFIILLYGQASISQVRLISQSLTDSSKSVLYIGAENRVQLITPTGKINGYTVTIEGGGGRVINTNNGWNEYIINVSSPGICEVAVKNKGKTVWQQTYKVETIPPPEARLGGLYHNDTISKSLVLGSPFLGVTLPGCYFNARYTITSFTATFVSFSQGDSVDVVTTGHAFTNEHARRIKELKQGDVVYFNNIRAFGISCREKLLPFSITIQ